MICVFQDWQDRYIHENYTRIMKDHLILTVSRNSHHITHNKIRSTEIWVSQSHGVFSLSPFNPVWGLELSGSGFGSPNLRDGIWQLMSAACFLPCTVVCIKARHLDLSDRGSVSLPRCFGILIGVYRHLSLTSGSSFNLMPWFFCFEMHPVGLGLVI